ncbi:MAG: hypothetical protein J0H92_14725 [Sphingobacteriales bacterium]|nr:hypothetical protein [Sphingobacteriales bacterium]OJW31673.1 MAG: hypothetical protein BGO54_14580 [Sphingobacteriales bacterium 46-32]
MNELNDPRLFKESDFFWVPLSLIVVYLFSYFKYRKYKHDLNTAPYFFPALNLRLISAVIYGLIIEYYYGYGDTIMYYNAVQDMHRAVSDDVFFFKDIIGMERLQSFDRIYPYFQFDGAGFTDLYMTNVHNFSVPKFALPFSLLFGKSYLGISFCFSLFAFGGCWRLFKTFSALYPELIRKIAVATLFLPSLLFWGSSFLKDSICLGALGFLVAAAIDLFYFRKKVFNTFLWLIVSSVILYYVKPYIVLSFLLAFVVAVFLMFNNRIKNKTVRSASRFFFLVIAIGGVFFLLKSLAAFEISSQYTTENIIKTMQGVQAGFETTEGEGSFFKVGNVENSFGSLLYLFPAGVGTSLFRPFPWEVRNPLMVLSALESFGLLILTIMLLRRAGFSKTIKTIVADPILVFCLIFAILFAGFVGVTTFNFGSLSRYRIPCLPFYLMLIFIVGHKTRVFSSRYVFKKSLF